MPRNANAGRRELFRAYLGSRPAIWAFLLGCGGAFLYGAYRRDPLIMAAGPAGVVALVTIAAALLADRAAEERFFEALARSLGLCYVGDAKLLSLTPLLGAGTRQWCEHWMQGALLPEHALAGGLGHFVYEVRKGRRTAQGSRQELTVARQTLTLCAIDVEAAMARFKGLYLRPRRGIFDGEDWLRGRGRTVELESADFSDRYELLISDDQSESAMRELLSPSLVDWLARHPLRPGFELRAGMLVVFIRRRLEEAGQFEVFRDAGLHLARRVLDELAEAAERRDRPAVGVGAGGLPRNAESAARESSYRSTGRITTDGGGRQAGGPPSP